MHILIPLALILLCLMLPAGAASADGPPPAEFFVATDGNDAWSGRLTEPNAAGDDGPFATLARAQQAMREGKPGPARTVLIRGGVYNLTEPITFTPEDSGAHRKPTLYAAYPGENPVFSGGSAITGWKRGEGELWVAEIPEVKAGDWCFHQLFVNGERRVRARTPNDGYLRIAGTLKPLTDRGAARRDDTYKVGFKYHPQDIEACDGLDDVNIILYHSWTASRHWIEELDEENHAVHFTNRSGWPVGYWDAKARYQLENYLQALDSPGEWFLDRHTGLLHYWPLEGEDMTQAEVIAPRLRRLLLIRGDAELGLPVSDLTLSGLSFQHADWVLQKDKIADGQAAIQLSAAVVATGARNCALQNCEVAHVGEYAIILGEGCKHNRVIHCHVHDLGAGGVRLGETTLRREPERRAEHNQVDNCFIHDGGHVFPAGIGVWVGRSSHNTVSHNEICDFLYSGCSVGWSWGYAPTSANHNVFEYNHIHNLGKGVLSDMGGIYSLGASPGTVERYNLIHDVMSYAYGGWGLYTDEGSSEIVLESNVVYNTKTGGFHQHYGRENLIRNNIFGPAIQPNIIRSRQEDHSSFTFQRNIVLTNNALPLGGNWGNGNYEIDHNLYWDSLDPNELEFGGMSFDEWQELGRDEHSLIADPLFVDPANNDYRLKENSPAFKLGFRSFDIADVGLYGEPEWVNAPKLIAREPMQFPTPTPPQPIADDFEDTAVGERPAGAMVSGEDQDKGASIRVTDETAAAGKHSLKFTDAPGLAHDWQPHMVYRPNYKNGVARVSFHLCVEEGAIFWHEWRDTHTPYRVGPSIRIEESGELRANGEALTVIPLGEWLRIQIVCELGRHSSKTYDLTITPAGEAPEEFKDIPVGNGGFRSLRWLGFVSLATDEAVFYVDELSVTRETD